MTYIQIENPRPGELPHVVDTGEERLTFRSRNAALAFIHADGKARRNIRRSRRGR